MFMGASLSLREALTYLRNQISNQPSPIGDLQTSFCTILIDLSRLQQNDKDVAKGYLQIADW
jgi:hypothetical protein